MTPAVEGAGDVSRADPVPGVQPEDEPDDGGFAGIWDQAAGGVVWLVAERAAAAFPFAGGGLAFHAGDDPVDDGVAFELGEHAQHLDKHPAHRGGGVERLGRRPEHHPGPVEVVEQGDQVAKASGEPVDPVDQQHVDRPGPSCGQGPLQARPAGGGAGGVVSEPGGLPPAGLGADVGGQPSFLGLDGVRLVLVVGGPAHVDAHAHVVAGSDWVLGRGVRHQPVPSAPGVLASSPRRRAGCRGVVSVARRCWEWKRYGRVCAGPGRVLVWAGMPGGDQRGESGESLLVLPGGHRLGLDMLHSNPGGPAAGGAGWTGHGWRRR